MVGCEGGDDEEEKEWPLEAVGAAKAVAAEVEVAAPEEWAEVAGADDAQAARLWASGGVDTVDEKRRGAVFFGFDAGLVLGGGREQGECNKSRGGNLWVIL